MKPIKSVTNLEERVRNIIWEEVHTTEITRDGRKKRVDKATTEIMSLMMGEKELWEIINKVDYPIDEYEARFDESDYSPNEHERFLINDYLQGFLDELVDALTGKIPKADKKGESDEDKN